MDEEKRIPLEQIPDLADLEQKTVSALYHEQFVKALWPEVRALPLKAIVSPTDQPPGGCVTSMLTTGGVFPAEIVIGALTVAAPLLSVTRRRTLYAPAAV